jgi:surface antigen
MSGSAVLIQHMRRNVVAAIAVFAVLSSAGLAGAPSASAYSVQCNDPVGISCITQYGYTGDSVWGYPVDATGNNCTNYAAFRLSQNGASNPGNLGNAEDWAASAQAKGFAVDGTPQVGAIAQWDHGSAYAPSLGHVAYVEEVTDTDIMLSDSNFEGGSKRWRVSPGDKFWPSNFIHIKDVPPPVVDPPNPVQRPSCSPVTTVLAYGAATAIQLTCGGESVKYVAPSAPAHGTIANFDADSGRLTYTPAAGYSGPDSFTFAASNAGGTSDQATATITVLPPKPTCSPVTKLVLAGTPTAMQLTCSGQAITYLAPSAPAHGMIGAFNATTGTLTYTPAAGYAGPDSFTFAASNAGGNADVATVGITISAPPVVSNLRANSLCVKAVRLNGAPEAGASGLSLSYTLDQSAQVVYELYRRDDSTRHKHCPQHATGHTQDTFTPLGSITGGGAPGENSVVVGSSMSARRANPARTRLGQTLRAGRHRVRLAQITNGRALAPGTYILFVSATNAFAQRSNTAHAKFFALGNRPPRYVHAVRSVSR